MSKLLTYCRQNSGFTLIELMIVVAIIAILATIAYPSYFGHVNKSRRADATAALLAIASRQERFYTANYTYATSVTLAPALGGLGTSAASESDYYTISIDNGAGITYSLRAVPNNGWVDAECNILTLDSTGVRDRIGGTLTADECWR